MTPKNFSTNKKFLNYFVAFFIVVYSGLNFFVAQNYTKVLISLFAIGLFIYYRKRINYKILLLIFYIIGIIIIQSIFWGGSAFTALTYIIFFIIVPYSILKAVGYNYNEWIVNILVFYALISLVFWTLTNVSPSFYNSLYSLAEKLGTDPRDINNEMAGRSEQFILYTYEPNRVGPFIRNPGPFHEPGAFAVFLIYGLIFNTLITGSFINKKNSILSIALITTFSTAGYIAFIFLISFYVWVSKLHGGLKISLFLSLIMISFLFYFSFEMMGKKVDDQYSSQAKVSLDTPTSGRIIGARKAIYVLSKYPLWGRGFQASTLATIDSPEGAGYGFMSFAARIGIPGILIFFFFFFKSIRQYCFLYGFNKRFASFSFIALLIVLFAQAHIQSILFFMLFMSSLIEPKFGEKIALSRINQRL
jgi:hypothetical protein